MNEKILLVDQEPYILKTLENTLVKKGYQIRSALRDEEAFGLVRSESFQLVITEIRIPNVEGLEFIKQVKALDNEIEVIVITGFASIENAVTALRDSGAADFITKPLDNIDQLFIAIDKALQKGRMRREIKTLLNGVKQAQTELECRLNALTGKLSEADRNFNCHLQFQISPLKTGSSTSFK
jgi:DNA-binding NtrC family response regulator